MASNDWIIATLVSQLELPVLLPPHDLDLTPDAPQAVAFTIIASGPAVTEGEDRRYDELTGINTCASVGLSKEEIDVQMARTPKCPHPSICRHRRPKTSSAG